jgi:hypothetical protein
VTMTIKCLREFARLVLLLFAVTATAHSAPSYRFVAGPMTWPL